MSPPNPFLPTDPAAMADVHPAFGSDGFSCKRKRRHEDLSNDFVGRDAKRRSTHSLPIRLSPSRPRVSSPPAYPMFTSIYQQPPTPGDTSDDESSHHPSDGHGWSSQPSSLDDRQPSQPNSNSSMSSIGMEYGDSGDVDMDLNLSSTSHPGVRRARSNDIIAPYRDSNFLSTTDTFARERVPTPITGHFDTRVNELPSVPRHHFPPLRTNLSPMIEQESWISRDGLPSPTEAQDMDTVMMLDQGNGTNGLYLSENGAHGGQQTERYGAEGNGSLSRQRSRTAKLHMGFLNGCDKCIQKVPGHYSHILRT